MYRFTSLDIELTQHCNLDCPYCYLGRLKQKGTITRETLTDCLDLLAVWSDTKTVAVNFYGGEPLCAFPQITFFVDAAKARGYTPRYTVVSNGTIDKADIVDYCKTHGMTVQRSLDGCPSAMELCRGKGTLDRYIEATQAWKDYGKTRRSTIIPETAKFLLGSLRYMAKLGFRKGFSPMPDYYADWKPEHIAQFKLNLWAMADELIKDVKAGKQPFYMYWFARDYNARFTAGKNYKPPIGCGAGRGLHCVSWDGYLYMCHRFTSEPRDSEFCAGKIRDIIDGTARGYGPTVMEGLQHFWTKQPRDKCQGCAGVYGCTRGCYHSNVKTTGDMREPVPLYCTLKQEAARVIQYIDNQLRPTHPDWFQPKRKK